MVVMATVMLLWQPFNIYTKRIVIFNGWTWFKIQTMDKLADLKHFWHFFACCYGNYGAMATKLSVNNEVNKLQLLSKFCDDSLNTSKDMIF